MEDVRPVFMHVDALDLLGVNVACNMVATVDDQAFLASLGGLVRKNGARESGADDQIIILGHAFLRIREPALAPAHPACVAMRRVCRAPRMRHNAYILANFAGRFLRE